MIERSSLTKHALYSPVKPEPASSSITNPTKTPPAARTHKGYSVRPKAAEVNVYPARHGKLHIINPGIESLGGNIRDMYRQRGLRAFVQGLSPTIFRQVANSAVRFTTYNFLKQSVQPNDSEQLPTHISFILGSASGAAVVAATQPIDVVKTRMQSVNARYHYGSALRTTYKIFLEEGLTTFWVGALPRFAKVILSGGIVFSVYESVDGFVKKGMKENPFAF